MQRALVFGAYRRRCETTPADLKGPSLPNRLGQVLLRGVVVVEIVQVEGGWIAVDETRVVGDTLDAIDDELT